MSYAGSEGALELALLDIKKQGYWYDNDSFIESDILWNTPKTPKISYEFNSRVETHTGTIPPLWIDIIPLFSISQSWLQAVANINFNNTDGGIVWNIISQDGWVSWNGSFDSSTTVWEKILDASWNLLLNWSERVVDILSWEDYLILQNLDATLPASYTLSWDAGGFTLPRSEIISSARVWKYTQNLKTTVDNTEFLWILRYSVYSWE